MYLDALLDQVVRANQIGDVDATLTPSTRRLALQADGEAAAWRLESLRRAGRPAEVEALLRALPESTRVAEALAAPLAAWPTDLDAMTRTTRRDSLITGVRAPSR